MLTQSDGIGPWWCRAAATGLLVAALLATAAAAQTDVGSPTGRELVEHVERLLWGKTNYGVSEMTVTTPSWTRTLKMRFWMDRPRYTLIRILAPPKEQGISSLRIQAEMWNYLPKVARIIKIPSSMMLQPWMGSDFSNDDLVKESNMVEDYTHTRLGVEQLDAMPAYRVQSIPKPEAAVVWGKIVYFIRVADRLPLKQEYYDERGELIKVMTFSNVRSLGGRMIPTRWTMQPFAKPGNRTEMVIREITFDRPIDPGLFTLANLQNPRE
jgi:outer membrane lipoprotein-sorting protein